MTTEPTPDTNPPETSSPGSSEANTWAIIGGIKASEGIVWPYPLSIKVFK